MTTRADILPRLDDRHAVVAAPYRPRKLFDSTWRTSCPIRPRHGTFRRWTRYVMLLVLASICGLYAYFTDEDRLALMVERFLGNLFGAEVEVRQASFGLFEGITVQDVRVLVPQPDQDSPLRPLPEDDRLLFTARTVSIEYDALSFVTGDLSALSVTAIDPYVRVVEDVRDGTWNLQRLGAFNREKKPGDSGGEPIKPPAFYLRNARVDALERIGNGSRLKGSVGLEAQLRPQWGQLREGDAVAYDFSLQSNFAVRDRDNDGGEINDSVNGGPSATGVLVLGGAGGATSMMAELGNVEFADVANLLPASVGVWAREHGVAGQMEVPEITFDFDPGAEEGRRTSFNARAELQGGRARLLPGIWLTKNEVLARDRTAELLETLALRPNLPNRLRADLSRWSQSWRPSAIDLRDARGVIVFDENGIAEADFSGEIAGNRLILSGRAAGYDQAAGVQLSVRTPPGEPFELPAAAPYIGSLPRPMREAYNRFRPRGRADLEMELVREEGSRPVLSVEARFFDASFELESLPYRVYDAVGRILVRPLENDDEMRHELVIQDLVALGNPESPNRDAIVRASGTIGPLEKSPGFNFEVTAEGLEFEPDLLAAMPIEARKGISELDPASHAALPGLPPLDFAGDLVVSVVRPPGPDQEWSFSADVEATRFSGALAAFPYPLDQATASLTVTHQGLTIHRSRIARPGDGHLGVAGETRWGDDVPDGLTYNLVIAGDGVAIDEDLLLALPPETQETIDKLGIGGRGEITAVVKGSAESDVDYDITLDLLDGRFWPADGTFYLEDALGRVRLRPGRIDLAGVSGTRGDTDIGIDGTIGLMDEGPLSRTKLSATVSDLPLDTGLYDLLPLAAQETWDWLRPTVGTADAVATIDIPTVVLSAEDGEVLSEGLLDTIDYDIELSLYDVSASPLGFPYPFSRASGKVQLNPSTVTILSFNAGREGLEAPAFAITGEGDLTDDAAPSGIWDLVVKASDVPVDDALKQAVPEGVAELFESLLLTGSISADMGNVRIITKIDEESEADIDAIGTIGLSNASFDIGVPVSALHGSIGIDMVRRNESMQRLEATVRADRFEAMERPGRDLFLRLSLDREAESLNFSDISADLSGGLLEATATMGWDEDEEAEVPYNAKVRLEGVAFEQLAGENFGVGTVATELRVEGIVGRPETRRGRGSFRVSGERLYNLPVLVNVIRVGNLLLPSELAISRVQGDFHDDGGTLYVSDLAVWTASDLIGPNPGPASFSGRGRVDFNIGTWDLEVRPGPGGWERLPLVGTFARFARDELLVRPFSGNLNDFDLEGEQVPTIRPTLDQGRPQG